MTQDQVWVHEDSGTICVRAWSTLPIRKGSISLSLSSPSSHRKRNVAFSECLWAFHWLLFYPFGHHTLAVWPSCSEPMDAQDLCPCHSLFPGHVSWDPTQAGYSLVGDISKQPAKYFFLFILPVFCCCFFFNYVCVSRDVHMCRCLQRPETLDLPGAGLIGDLNSDNQP